MSSRLQPLCWYSALPLGFERGGKKIFRAGFRDGQAERGPISANRDTRKTARPEVVRESPPCWCVLMPFFPADSTSEESRGGAIVWWARWIRQSFSLAFGAACMEPALPATCRKLAAERPCASLYGFVVRKCILPHEARGNLYRLHRQNVTNVDAGWGRNQVYIPESENTNIHLLGAGTRSNVQGR